MKAVKAPEQGLRDHGQRRRGAVRQQVRGRRGDPHIELAEDDGSEAYNEESQAGPRLPRGLYKIDGDGAKSFDYAGCLECGTCRIACEGTIVKKWVNPGPTMGVEYRLG